MSRAVSTSLSLLLFFGVASVQAEEKSTDPDEILLRCAGLPTKEADLMEVLRRRSVTSGDPVTLQELVRQLGSESFTERQQAARELSQLGAVALPVLRKALQNRDAEVVRGAKTAIETIEAQPHWTRTLGAAVRFLVKRRPAGLAEMLLRILPQAADESTIEEIWYGLDATAFAGGKADPCLVVALKDRDPSRRAVAACLLARRGDADQRKAICALLKDPEPMVRLRAAQGLLAAHDGCGLTTLIELLSEPAIEIAWQAEELLHWVADGNAPTVAVGSATAPECQACRKAWDGWLRDHGTKIDWEHLENHPRRPGLVMILDGNGKLWLAGCEGTTRYACCPDLRVEEFQWLPNGRLLLIHSPLVRKTEQRALKECDVTGKVCWQTASFYPHSFQRLPDGRTLCGSRERLLELDTSGREIARREVNAIQAADGERLQAHLTRDGRWYIGFTQGDEPSLKAQIWEIDVNTAEILRQVPLSVTPNPNAHDSWCFPLRSGHWLVVAQEPPRPDLAWKLSLVTDNGQEERNPWLEHSGSCFDPYTELCNGNLVGNFGTVMELDRDGRRVWEATFADQAQLPRLRARVICPLVRFGFSRPRAPAMEVTGTDVQLEALKSPSAQTRLRALVLLGQKPLTDPILNAGIAALTDPDRQVREEALKIVAAAGPRAKSAIPALIGLFDDEVEKGGFSAVSIQALHQIGPEAVPALLTVFEDRERPRASHRRAAAAGTLLCLSNTSEKARAAAKAAFNDSDPLVRRSVAWWMGYQGRNAQDYINDLAKLLEDEDPIVRDLSATSLYELGPVAKEAIPALIKGLKGKRLPGIAVSALMAIDHNNPEVLPCLLFLVQPGIDPDCAWRAAEGLGEFRQHAGVVVPSLMAATKDERTVPNRRNSGKIIRECALDSLGKMGPEAKAAVPQILTLLNDVKESRRVREEAARALAQIDPMVAKEAAGHLSNEQGERFYLVPLLVPPEPEKPE